MSDEWLIEERKGDASTLHAAWPEVARGPDLARVAICRVAAPAVVLGSTQRHEVVDAGAAAAAGIAVVRRRSGGGAVLVTPDDPVWIDVWLPASHRLWSSDVGRAFDWLGDVWVGALAAVGVAGLSSHRQGFVSCTRWSSLVCFGGVGTGEVVTGDGRKVVGLAQRRNREGAWFHGACALRWDPVPLLGILAMAADERRAAADGLSAAVAGVVDLAATPGSPSGAGKPVPDGPAVASAFIDALP
jgi:lipoate-protein ligase A